MTVEQTTQVVTTGVAAATGLWLGLPEHTDLVALAGVSGGFARWLAPSTGIAPFWPGGLRLIVLGFLAAIFLWPLASPLAEMELGIRLALTPAMAALFGGFFSGILGATLIELIVDLGSIMRKRAREKVHGHDS